MNTFVLALESVGHAIRVTFVSLAYHDATWGFLTGFATATGLYAIITSENPRHWPSMLTKSPHESFQSSAKRAPDGSFLVSYTAFQREYNRVRTVFYLAFLALLIVVIISLLRA